MLNRHVICLIAFGIIAHNGYATSEVVPVVHLTGKIKPNVYAPFMKQLKETCLRPDIRTLIIHADSSGGQLYLPFLGSVTECNLRKSVRILVPHICASACYYAAVGARRIIASPLALIGSIGVIRERKHITNNTVKLAQSNNGTVEIKHFTGGEKTIAQTEYNPVSDTEREVRQQETQEHYRDFVEYVRSHRPQLKDRNETEWADAHIFSGVRALKIGLIDRVGSLSDVLDEIAAELNIDPETINLEDLPPATNPDQKK